jgi:hypothetical protein
MCVAATPRATDALDSGRFLFITRSFPEIHRLDLPPPYIATYEIPLSPVAGESRNLAVLDNASSECAWRITRCEGVEVEGSLPAQRVRLHSETGSPGRVVVEKPFGTAACPGEGADRRYPPCMFESEPGDALQAFVAGS